MSEKKYVFKRKLSVALAFIAVIFSFTLVNNCAFAKNSASLKQTVTINKNFNQAQDVLSAIDKYQERYFAIVKRNDVLIRDDDDKALNKDRKELKKLYKEVEKQITNKQYIKKYKDIEKRYSKCEEETTIGMNSFAENNYNEIDALLNEVYEDVKSKISPEDLKKLTLSERKWLKEVEDYQKVFDSMEYGSIGTIIYYDYQINMRQFRMLLLMLYIQ